ncbi:hypothetical protein MAR_ORF265 [Marseillevirus marseillevirus]|uniref:Uncharacterized protein n=1 Tax=Marseillevirus marseillevirus TaxID=694581 RepID=D2XAR2_GBMV|nr:hypothetical protein MAR_ORF265 [Marseillevirus marseillevirus]ADB04039.1 hypothetical protein MAR_ORF265 [Marseillevirus marseillevirus]
MVSSASDKYYLEIIFLLGHIRGIDGKLKADGADQVGCEGGESAIQRGAEFNVSGLNFRGGSRAHRESGSHKILHRNNHAVLRGESGARCNVEGRKVSVNSSRRGGSGKSRIDHVDMNGGRLPDARPVAGLRLGVGQRKSGGRRGDGISSRCETREELASDVGGGDGTES